MNIVKVKDVATFVRGVSYKKEQATKEKKSGYLPLLRANNISAGSLIFDDLVYVPKNLVIESQYVKPGDIIVSMSSGSKAHVGKVALAKQSIDYTFGAFCGKVSPLRVFPPYLYYLLCDSSFRQHIETICKGTNINNLKQSYIMDYEIPVPPFSEQIKIVSRIEELFSELDTGVETLQKIKQQLAVYRQAALTDAFREAIKASKAVAIQDVCEDIKVGIVIKPAQYYTDSTEGVRAFRSANVREFYTNDNDWVYLSKEGHSLNSRSEVHIGDVLIVRSGYPGTSCVVDEKHDGCNAIDILIAVPNKSIILPEYLCAFTNSPLGRKLVAEKKRGMAQAHLNVGGYSKMKIPVPSLDVQKRIVDEISMRLSLYDDTTKSVDSALQQSAAMRQSILKQAFGRITQ